MSEDGRRPLRPATRAAQAAGATEPAYGGMVPAIYPSAPYLRDADGRYLGGRSYARDRDPTAVPAEALLAELEGGAEALLFASGMAAATTVFETLGPGAHVLVPRHMYWTVRAWLDHLAARIAPGSVILFDEYLCTSRWREDEHKAFQEAVARHGWRYRYRAFNLFAKQAVVVIC